MLWLSTSLLKKGIYGMKRSEWLYLLGIVIAIIIAVAFIMKKDVLFKSKEEKKQAIITAIQKNEYDKLSEYIKKGYPITFETKEGVTPVQKSISLGNLSITELLVENGADVTEDSSIPLVHLIISSIDDYRRINQSPEYEAIINTYKGILEDVEKNHIDKIKEIDEDGNNALHLAALSGHPDIVKYVIKLGVNPTATNRNNETPLMLAVKSGQIQAVRELSSFFENEKDIEENTLYYHAAMNGRDEVLAYLLKESKGDINEKNSEGKTALMIASEYGYASTVKILLENGANMKVKSKQGKTAFEYAKKWNHKDVMKLLNKDK